MEKLITHTDIITKHINSVYKTNKKSTTLKVTSLYTAQPKNNNFNNTTTYSPMD